MFCIQKYKSIELGIKWKLKKTTGIFFSLLSIKIKTRIIFHNDFLYTIYAVAERTETVQTKKSSVFRIRALLKRKRIPRN